MIILFNVSNFVKYWKFRLISLNFTIWLFQDSRKKRSYPFDRFWNWPFWPDGKKGLKIDTFKNGHPKNLDIYNIFIFFQHWHKMYSDGKLELFENLLLFSQEIIIFINRGSIHWQGWSQAVILFIGIRGHSRRDSSQCHVTCLLVPLNIKLIMMFQ